MDRFYRLMRTACREEMDLRDQERARARAALRETEEENLLAEAQKRAAGNVPSGKPPMAPTNKKRKSPAATNKPVSSGKPPRPQTNKKRKPPAAKITPAKPAATGEPVPQDKVCVAYPVPLFLVF